MYKRQALLTAVLLSGVALAQTSAGAKVNASASQNSSVSADRSGGQAQTSSSASADVSAQAAHDHRSNQGNENQRSPHESAGASRSGELASGTAINAVLVKPVDARKNKPGDVVMAKTTQDVKSEGRVVIPKGSRMVGSVTQAQARVNGESQSSLGIAFHHVIFKNGQELPVNTSVQAIAAAQTATTASVDDHMSSVSAGAMGSEGVSSGVRSGGALLGGVSSSVGSTAGAVTNTSGNLSGTVGGTLRSATHTDGSIAVALNSTSSGIVGLPGMTLTSRTSAAAQGSVITSAEKNIHLDSGTQMLLRVTSSASQQ